MIEGMENTNTLKGLIAKANRVMGKTLTTKDRKKLPDSTYCGPGRSFPCNDCAHVAAAKAFLGRSKFSAATKKKIAACINAKAKKLGCNVTKKAKANEDLDLQMSEEFASTRELVEKSIKNPGMELNFVDIII